MRKFINVAALIVFIWLLLDAFNVPSLLLNFLLAGQLPLTGIIIDPGFMLVIITIVSGMVVLELLARRISIARRIRYHLFAITAKHDRLPKRRFGRA